MTGDKIIPMSQPTAGRVNVPITLPIALPVIGLICAPFALPIAAPVASSISPPIALPVVTSAATVPQVPAVSHEIILELERKARDTYKISVNICKITSILDLKDFGKPMEVLKRINEFALRSSDISVCGESCRIDDVFFRAIALMEGEVVGWGDQRLRAANAVRRARVETKAEYEVRKAVREAEKEKRDGKTYLKMGYSKK